MRLHDFRHYSPYDRRVEWTQEKLVLLKSLHQAGYSFLQIAIQLECSKNVISGKIRRLRKGFAK